MGQLYVAKEHMHNCCIDHDSFGIVKQQCRADLQELLASEGRQAGLLQRLLCLSGLQPCASFAALLHLGSASLEPASGNV